MPQKFDAYHVWLGIPPEEQPPSYYRLLGLAPFEDDKDAIATAAYERMTRLRTFQTGQHVLLSQKLFKEVAAAKACLLRPQVKANYDRKLRQTLEAKGRAGGELPRGDADSADDETCLYQAKPAVAKQAVKTAKPTTAATNLGTVGEYELIEQLGQGGMGTVYKALHTKLGRYVALKVLHAERVADESAITRFEREMRAVGGLDHANIVRAHDAREVAGTRILVMELVEGMDLSEIVRHEGPLAVADASEVIRQAALGLQHAHEHELVHRDIKPSNLMVTPAGQVKILDMGLALLGELHSPEAKELTTTGQMMGTLDYMAPEQGDDSHLVDIRADIYSLGATFYKLLSGQAPFAGDKYDTPVKKLMALATEQPQPIQERRGNIPRELVAVLNRMLAKDPSQRFDTPAAVADAVGRFTTQADLPNLVARAQKKPPVKQPSRAMEATAASMTSGLTRFFQKVTRKQPHAARPVTSTDAGLSIGKRVLLIGAPALAILLLGAIVLLVWGPRNKSTPLPTGPVLVFDWPADERLDMILLIDGDQVRFPDTGPLQHECASGEHKILARRRGFKPYATTVKVKPGDRLSVPSIWLPQTYVVMELPSSIRGTVRLEIDGRVPDLPVGEVEVDAERIKMPIAAGQHTVRISRPNYEPFEQQLVMTEGEVATVTPEWRAKAGTSEVASAEEPDEPIPLDVSRPEQQKLPIPPEDARQSIASTIEESYSMAEAMTPAQKVSVAREMLNAAPVKEDPAERYMLLNRALELAVEAADASLAEQAIDALGESFEVDAAERKQTALAKIDEVNQAREAADKARAEAERLAEAARQRQMRYREALEPVESDVATWDFQSAAAKLQQIGFDDDPQLTDKLRQRRDEVKRMSALKERIIAKVNTTQGRLSKKDLFLKGLGGVVLGADDKGIHAELSSGKNESVPWGELNDKARARLLEVAIDRSQPDDWISAGVMAFASGDVELAERLLDRAGKQGGDVGPYLAPLAEAAFAQATDSVEKNDYERAVAALDALQKKYGKTTWFAANKDVIAATRAEIDRAQYRDAAEKLYVRSKQLFEEEQLFDLRDVVASLKAEFPDSAAVTETAREPSFQEMEKAVADLGKRFIVRLDGKGDYASIQEAINAAEPGCLIEIQDEGPYNEKIVIPDGKAGITLRGKKGLWPNITSLGPNRDFEVLVDIKANNVVLERLTLIHSTPFGEKPNSVRSSVSITMRSVIMFMGVDGYGVSVREGEFTDCLLLSNAEATGRGKYQNCLLLGKSMQSFGASQWTNCIVKKISYPRGAVLLDTIIGSIFRGSGNRIENCVFFTEKPPDDSKNCIAANPQFVNPAMLDFRLGPQSPCRGSASDGGDIGCRYTLEMVKMCEIALALRAKGLVKF